MPAIQPLKDFPITKKIIAVKKKKHIMVTNRKFIYIVDHTFTNQIPYQLSNSLINGHAQRKVPAVYILRICQNSRNIIKLCGAVTVKICI